MLTSLVLTGLSVLRLPNYFGWGMVAACTSLQELGGGVIAIRAVLVLPTHGLNAPPQNEGNVESVHDDPQQIADFEDLILKENFQEVDSLLRTYVAAHPRSWRAYYFLGYVQLRQHRITDSIKALAKSLELNVNNAEAHKLLGKDLSVIGRYDVATREFEQALRLDPSLAEVHYNLGKVYSIQDDFHGAKEEFEKAIRLNPNYMEAHNALGFAMEALGDDVAAFEDYQAALRINEEHHGKFVAPYINLSGYYNRRGELDVAVEYAKKALEMSPKSDLAYFQIAKAYRARKDWNGAAEALENAIAIKPSSSQYHYALGIAYRRLGKIKESEQALEGFRRLEKQTADLENQRREARRSALGLELRPDE